MSLKPYVIEPADAQEITLCGDIKAGFPSPADDIQEKLDILKLLVPHPASTFFFRVSGISMTDASIDEGDIVVVDKAKEPFNRSIAVCFIDGEFTLKRLSISAGKIRLIPANSSFRPIEITDTNDFMIWGIVTYVIKKM